MITRYSTLDELPPGCEALFDGAGSFFCSEAWFRVSIAHALPDGATPALAVFTENDRPQALFPMQIEQHGRALRSLTSLYTGLYQPLMHRDADEALARLAGQAFGAFCRVWPTVRLDALDPDWPLLAPFLAGVRQAGLLFHCFDHFGNWRQNVAGCSWSDYLDSRPGALRETIRRKLRRADRDATVRFELLTTREEVEGGIEAYAQVYARSWKPPEPFPHFNSELMRAAATRGVLRLGLLWQNGVPVAAQYWIVVAGEAAVLKLAHDEAAKSLSPGTLLTALMIRHLLNEEQVVALDFGRGDDPYKRLWVNERRQRVGTILMNPRRPGGLLALLRHGVGSATRAIRVDFAR